MELFLPSLYFEPVLLPFKLVINLLSDNDSNTLNPLKIFIGKIWYNNKNIIKKLVFVKKVFNKLGFQVRKIGFSKKKY
jgi:hypothetical protein